MSEKYYTADEIEEGVAAGRLHWVGGVGGCGNMYIRESTFWTRWGGLIVLIVTVTFCAVLMGME